MPTLILAKRPSSFVFDGTSGLFLPFDIVIDFTNTLFDHAKRLSIQTFDFGSCFLVLVRLIDWFDCNKNNKQQVWVTYVLIVKQNMKQSTTL